MQRVRASQGELHNTRHAHKKPLRSQQGQLISHDREFCGSPCSACKHASMGALHRGERRTATSKLANTHLLQHGLNGRDVPRVLLGVPVVLSPFDSFQLLLLVHFALVFNSTPMLTTCTQMPFSLFASFPTRVSGCDGASGAIFLPFGGDRQHRIACLRLRLRRCVNKCQKSQRPVCICFFVLALFWRSSGLVLTPYPVAFLSILLLYFCIFFSIVFTSMLRTEPSCENETGSV